MKHTFGKLSVNCGNKTLPCDICGKTLVDQKGLSNHKQVIHNWKGLQTVLENHIKVIHEKQK